MPENEAADSLPLVPLTLASRIHTAAYEMNIILAYFHARALRRERRFRDRLDPLELSDSELIQKYRFPRQELTLLFQELQPQLERRTRRSQALPTHTQVLLALRFLASGSFQHVIGDTAGNIYIVYWCCMLPPLSASAITY